MSLQQNAGIIRVLPDDQFFDDPEDSLTFLLLFLFGGKEFRPGRRIIDQRGENYRTTGSKRTSRPPEVEG